MSKQSAAMAQKIEVFCQSIMEGLSQSDAYRKASPKSRKWKPCTVHVKACVMGRMDKVKVRLAELRERHLIRHDDTVERIRQELIKLSFYDPRVFFDDNGNLKPLSEIPAEAAACITGMEVITTKAGDGEGESGYLKKIRFSDKLQALKLLGNLYNLWSTEREPGTTVVQQNDNRKQTVVNIYDMSPEEATRHYLEFMKGNGDFNVTNKPTG